MTEYDFSPEAYHRHLENMHGISRWVDRTEQHRPQFENAAALTGPAHDRKEHRDRSGRRRGSRRAPPPSMQLPPHGLGMMYTPQYPSPSHSSSSSHGFTYSSTPNSPGPMPSSLYHQPPPPQPQFMGTAPGYGYGAYPYSPYVGGGMQGYSGSPSPSYGYGHGSPYSFPSPPLFGQIHGMGGGSMAGPGYIVLPQSRGRRGSHRRGSMSYVYV